MVIGMPRPQNAKQQDPVDLLLIEDNPGDVRLTKEALREGPVRINLSVASDGVEAMDFLHRRGKYHNAPRPELILLDLNLPRKSGREVLSEIKADPVLRRIPVVVMTTSTADQDVARAYSLNANCYVAKPIQLDEFLAAIHSIEDFWFGRAVRPPIFEDEDLEKSA
jgi:two-component system, chemotaxis family, response regulator Rcp1